jgi:2-keto-3-deoxy-L-rhamnonate aldolase RhmA
MGVRLKEALKSGRLVRVACMGQLCHPKMVELVALAGGYDAVWLDQEHAGLTVGQVEEACRAARAGGLDSFVRLTATDYATVMRPLEAGAGGVMAAQVRSAGEVEDVVRWAKFHPRGCRGYNATGCDAGYGTVAMDDYLRRQNAESFVAVQIENAAAVEEVERIAAVPDVDVLFVGPADLTQSLGLPGQWEHPRFWEAVERVARAARAAGVAWAVLPWNVPFARRCVELGCRMLSLGLDVWAVRRGWRAFQEEFGEFFDADDGAKP